MSTNYTPESAMAIFAHPDDIEFGCAGTLARWARGGTRISHVICTSGEVGISKNGMTKTRAAEIREAEQRAASAITGAKEVIFLREPDGMLEATMDLRRRLVREIRRFRPEVVMCDDPTIVWAGEDYINHPDHRAAAAAALDAAFPAAGQPNLFEELAQEGLRAHKPRKVYVHAWEGGDTFVNITDTIDLKIKALRAHTSQMEEMGGWDPEDQLKEWARERARGKEMEYAESFRVISLESDENWEKRKGHIGRD
jgi:LmbE family N-acetylglucosaminyl deacetylase